MAANEMDCKNFEPTKEQRRAAELLANPNIDMTKEQIAAEVGIAPSTLWRWEQKPEFRQYVNDLVAQYTDAAVPAAWRALVSRMKNDTQAIKLFFELKNMYRDRKEVNATVTIENMLEELDEVDD